MMSGDHHGQALLEVTDRFVPLAEATLTQVGPALAKSLQGHLSEIAGHLPCDLEATLRLHGRQLQPELEPPLRSVARGAALRWAGELARLVPRLERAERGCVSAFISGIVVDLRAALRVQGALRARPWRPTLAVGGRCQDLGAAADALQMSIHEVVAAIQGDTAFRALHYFLELAQPLARTDRVHEAR